MKRRSPFKRLLVESLLIGCLVVAARPVTASTPETIAAAPMQQVTATPAPPQTPGSTSQPGPTPAATPTPTPGSSVTITENIFHILSFPFRTMMDAVVQMGSEIMQSFYKDAEWIYGETLNSVLYNDYGIAPGELGGGSATPLFMNIIQNHWNVALVLALTLLPATLILTAVSALRMGATSSLGYADLKEALLGWVIAAGAAAASYYLLGLAHRLSLAAARSILTADFGEEVSGFALARAFFNAAALSQIALLFPPAALYVGFFVVFLATTIILALGLAIAAYTALVYLLSVIAPVVITLGVLPPLRWLHSLWLKTIVVVFLTPVVDAFLLKAALSLYRGFFDPGQGGTLFGFLASLFIIGGVLSVLITINFKVGEMVFGALAEIHRHAWDATTGVMQMVLSVAALLAGGAIGGLALGGSAAGAAGGGAGSGAVGLTVSGSSPPPSGAGTGTPTNTGIASSAVPGTGVQQGASTPSNALHTGSSLGRRTEEIADQLSARMSGTARQHDESETAIAGTPVQSGSAERMASVAQEESGEASGHAELEGIATPDVDTKTQEAHPHRTPSDSPTAHKGAQPAAQDQGGEEPRRAARPRGAEIAHPQLAQASPPTARGNADAPLRRARLAEGFGRILAQSTRNPLVRGFGLGLQGSSLLAQHQVLEVPPTSQQGRPQEPLLGSARRWSASQELNQEPYALFDLGRDNTDLMLGGMFRSFMQTERAVDMQALLPVVQDSYGQWLAQERPGGLAAQREFFDLAMQEGNKASAGHMVGALNEWAGRHGVRLEANLPARVQGAFAASVPIEGDRAPDVELSIQNLLRSIK